MRAARDRRKDILLLATKGPGSDNGTSAATVRLEETKETQALRMIEIRYGETELKLPEDVDLKAVAVLLNALRRHD